MSIHRILAPLLSVAVLGAGCGALDEDPAAGPAPAAEGYGRLVSWVPAEDGSLKPVEYALSYQDYLALHEARRNGRARAAGQDVEVRRQPLQVVGYHGDGCTGGGSCNFGGCGDDRTTWVYNKPNGWSVAPGDLSTLVIGCFGAGSGSWLGTTALAGVGIPPSFSEDWKAGLRSMWTSNTDKVGLVQVSGMVSVVSTFNPWTTHNLTPGTFDQIRHCTVSSSCLF